MADMERDIASGHRKKAEKQSELMDVTVMALERMLPKKPTEVDERVEADFYYLSFMCPTCDDAVIGQPYKPKNCKHCGQRLDWSEEHEEIK